MTVEELKSALEQLLRQGAIEPDYTETITHENGPPSLKCYSINSERIAVVMEYSMLVLSTMADGEQCHD
jgi:hypothetical protein